MKSIVLSINDKVIVFQKYTENKKTKLQVHNARDKMASVSLNIQCASTNSVGVERYHKLPWKLAGLKSFVQFSQCWYTLYCVTFSLCRWINPSVNKLLQKFIEKQELRSDVAFIKKSSWTCHCDRLQESVDWNASFSKYWIMYNHENKERKELTKNRFEPATKKRKEKSEKTMNGLFWWMGRED